jgi:Tfp pilus assembly protein PilF
VESILGLEEKRRRMKDVPMKVSKRPGLFGALWTVLLGTVLLIGCSSTARLDLTTAEDQMKVGAQAAKLGLWREAMFRFNRAIELEPENAQAYNNLAVAYESNGEFEKARESYLQALRINRGDPYIQKNYSRFAEFYQRYEKVDTKKPEDGGEEKPNGTEAKP